MISTEEQEEDFHQRQIVEHMVDIDMKDSIVSSKVGIAMPISPPETTSQLFTTPSQIRASNFPFISATSRFVRMLTF